MKVIWLASWYPNKISPLAGDFIKRHAEAVSQYCQVHVVHVVKDVNAVITSDVLIEEMEIGSLKETIVYYHSVSTKFGLFDKYLSDNKFKELYKKEVLKSSAITIPDLVNVHIGMKAGSIALWLKKKSGIPYIVSEQWTGILYESIDSFDKMPWYIKRTWTKVVKNADGLTAVSNHLAQAIKKRFGVYGCEVIPNVVDTNIFYYLPSSQKQKRNFIHISTLVDFKNPIKMLEGFAMVVKDYRDAKLTIIGPPNAEVKDWIIKNDCSNNIQLVSEMSQQQLVNFIRQSDALILFSRYETFGCVLIEATACGIPVIASDVPVIRETIYEGQNGLFAKDNDSAALAQTIRGFIKDDVKFDAEIIAEKTKNKYNYSVIGKQFYNLYQKILTGTTPPLS